MGKFAAIFLLTIVCLVPGDTMETFQTSKKIDFGPVGSECEKDLGFDKNDIARIYQENNGLPESLSETYGCFFICFMEKSNITMNNTIDVEGLTDHKNDSDESDKTVNDDILLPLLNECKNKEGNQTIHKCVQGYQTFQCVMNAFDMTAAVSSMDLSQLQAARDKQRLLGANLIYKTKVIKVELGTLEA